MNTRKIRYHVTECLKSFRKRRKHHTYRKICGVSRICDCDDFLRFVRVFVFRYDRDLNGNMELMQ